MTDLEAPLHRAQGVKAAIDALHHEDLADAIVGHITGLPSGSVISVQGPWGRGKTDVVARVFERFDRYAGEGSAPEPIWIDPWQYGRPDLIRPVVVQLLERMRQQHRGSDRLRKAATSLLHASNALVFKAVSVLTPFGAIIEAGQPEVDKLIDDLMGDGQKPDPDADPVHEMARRFYELVDEVLGQPGGAGKPLLICVDDLDRCLPDHQIAMLEAIYFLTSAGARCSFLVALDPLLVQQAAITHYRTDGFDSNQYLDKLFQLRVNLTALQPDKIERLIEAELQQPVTGLSGTGPAREVLREGLGAGPAAVRAAFSRVFVVPELTNPRLVHRVFERLRLAADANIRKPHAELRDPALLEALVAWCAIAERWSQLRQLLQASPIERWAANLSAICGFYGIWGRSPAATDEKIRAVVLAEAASITSRLPGQRKQPDLGSFISARILAHQDSLAALRRIDDILIGFGL